MKAIITAYGDPSVGIPGITITVENLPPYDDDETEWVETTLADCFKTLLDEPVSVELEKS